jgi:two-component system, OmpR family, sensor kinase
VLIYCEQVGVALDSILRSSSPGQFVQVQVLYTRGTRNQNFLLYSRLAPVQGGNILPAAMAQASGGQRIFLTVPCPPDTCRVFLTPLVLPAYLQQAGATGALEVFQKEPVYIDIQRKVDLILELGVPLGLLIALVAGWWIARAALRPIDRISRSVRSIGDSRDLSQRLRFVGPDDEVGRLATTVDGMMERLERAFETQRRFIADASHELRTPLTSIRGNADLIEIAPPEERELCIRSIRREAARMSRLVADLLLLAEADAEQQYIHKQEVDLDDVLSEVFRSAQLLSADKLTVEYTGSDEPILLFADPDRLKQLFLNLVDNAIKFTPTGGRVTLLARREEHGAVVTVDDNGPGIPSEERDAIFRRFYRLDASRTHRGSGLGLSICAWIVDSHQGRIDVSSDGDTGTTFTVTLPGIVEPAASTKDRSLTRVGRQAD